MNFIHENMISVGYNPNNGQKFFDILNKYRRYIHSFFFSVSYDMRGNKLDTNRILADLKSYETYGIPGNLLFNDFMGDLSLEVIENNINLINEVRSVINLTSVTVIDLQMAKIIKEKFPELEVHLSVRYFDWNINISCIELIERDREYLVKYIDVINISGFRSYNDHELFKAIKDLSIKTKFIANEGCMINKERNFQKFPEFKYAKCYYDNGCNGCEKTCVEVLYREIPWLELSSINFYKEQLQFIPYDIIKLSERINSIDEVIYDLEYWCNPNRTNKLFTRYTDINISDDNFQIYMNWLHNRSTSCNGDCYSCKACEKFYNLLKGE